MDLVKTQCWRTAWKRAWAGAFVGALGLSVCFQVGCAAAYRARSYPYSELPVPALPKGAPVDGVSRALEDHGASSLPTKPGVISRAGAGLTLGEKGASAIQTAGYRAENPLSGEQSGNPGGETLPRPLGDGDPDPILGPRPGERTGNTAGPNGNRLLRTDHRLGFDEVINAVLLNDPKLMAGFQSVNQANADALTASLVPNPTVLADVLMLPLTRPFVPLTTGGPPQQDVMVSYPIDWFVFGKRAANMAAANEGVRISEADFANLVRLRITEGAMAFYDVLEARALLSLAQQNTDVLLQVEKVIIRSAAEGKRSKIDVSRIKLDLLQSRQALRDAQTALVSAKARLRALIGRQDRDPDFDIRGSLDQQMVKDAPAPEQAFDLAVENRPDVLMKRLRAVQTEANITVEERRKYPDLVPMMGWTRQYQVAAMDQPDASSWNASITTSLPLFNRNQGNRAKAVSIAAQAKTDYEATLVALRAEIETAAQELRAAQANSEAAASEQLQLANEVLESVTKSYEAGERPLVDFLDAQRNFRETNRSFISMRAAYWRALYRYWSTIGRQIQQS